MHTKLRKRICTLRLLTRLAKYHREQDSNEACTVLLLYVANNTCSKEDFIYEMEMHGYKVDWKDDHKYITFTTPDGHKCRDNKLFAEQLLRKNLEIYFALGGCESGLADQYKSYVNDLRPEHAYTVGDGLFNFLKNLLETMPYDGLFTPPVEDHQLDIV